MAKSVLDAGWSPLRAQLLYKGAGAGKACEEVNAAHAAFQRESNPL
jgi:hypothetical protein